MCGCVFISASMGTSFSPGQPWINRALGCLYSIIYVVGVALLLALDQLTNQLEGLFENQDSLIDHNFLRQNDIFLDIHSF
jgi:hypothetical protein